MAARHERNLRDAVIPEDPANTNFAAYDEQTLSWMLHRGAPEIVTELAEGWGMVGVALTDRAHDMEIEYRRMSPSWTGASAQSYEEAVQSLIAATQKVGRMAGAVSEIMHANASALKQARSMYPPPDNFQPLENRPRVWEQFHRIDTGIERTGRWRE